MIGSVEERGCGSTVWRTGWLLCENNEYLRFEAGVRYVQESDPVALSWTLLGSPQVQQEVPHLLLALAPVVECAEKELEGRAVQTVLLQLFLRNLPAELRIDVRRGQVGHWVGGERLPRESTLHN